MLLHERNWRVSMVVDVVNRLSVDLKQIYPEMGVSFRNLWEHEEIMAEDLSAKGRADLTLKMPKGIYILELKYDDTADNALRQIDERGYASKYTLDGRPIVKVGLAFSSKERNIMEWKSEVRDGMK